MVHGAEARPRVRPAAPDTSRRFGRDDRIRVRSDFQAVQGRGRKVHTAHYLMMVLPRSDERTRLGLTVTKKIGTAVERNRVKRVLREVFRLNRSLFPSGFDIVVIAKSGAPALGYEASLAEVRSVEGALRSAGAKARARG